MEVDPPETPTSENETPPQLSLADELALVDTQKTTEASREIEAVDDIILLNEANENGGKTKDKNAMEIDSTSTPADYSDVAKDVEEELMDADETVLEVGEEIKATGEEAKDSDEDSRSSSIVQLDPPGETANSEKTRDTDNLENGESMDVANDIEAVEPLTSEDDAMPSDSQKSGETDKEEWKSAEESPDKTVERTESPSGVEQADDNASTSLINGDTSDKATPAVGGDENNASLASDERDPFASNDAIPESDEGGITQTPDFSIPGQGDIVQVNEQGIVPNGDVSSSTHDTVTSATTTTSTANASLCLDEDELGELVIAEKPPAPAEVEVIVPEEDASAVAEPAAEGSVVGKISVANLTANESETAEVGEARTRQSTSSPSPSSSATTTSSSKLVHSKRGSPCKVEDVIPPVENDCTHCNARGLCRKKVTVSGVDFYLCSEKCVLENRALCKATTGKVIPSNIQTSDLDLIARKCSFCQSVISKTASGSITWEVMEFCNEDCLGKYQSKFTNVCVNCGNDVVPASMGKYCVRFSHEVKQFCSTTCLDTYKKNIKTCSFCQKNLNDSPDSFLAPVRGIDQFKDFCSQDCLEKYDCITNKLGSHLTAHECVVCRKFKIVQFEVIRDQETETLCSEVCLAAFKFANDIDIGCCSMCNKFYDRKLVEECCVFNNSCPLTFCSQHCMNINVLSKRLILPCAWCKAKKYNFDMVRKRVMNDLKQEENLYVCSLNCLALHSVSATQVQHSNQAECCYCKKYDYVQYHLTMSDLSIRNFCSYGCVAAFQKPYQSSSNATVVQPIPTGTPKRSGMLRPAPLNTLQAPSVVQQQAANAQQESSPMISSVTSLKRLEAPPPLIAAPQKSQPSKQLFKYPILIKPRDYIEVKNKSTSCRPFGINKGVSCKPNRIEVSTQCEPQVSEECITADADSTRLKALIPVPVPIYVPTPLAMYTLPSPVVLPMPFPVPVPVFIPTTRKTTKGIFKLLKRIQEKLPESPEEADVFMMAAMAASESTKKRGNNGSRDENCSTSRLLSSAEGSSSTSSSDEDSGREEKRSTNKGKRQKRKTRRASSLSTESSLTQNYDDDSRTENGMDSSRLSVISENSELGRTEKLSLRSSKGSVEGSSKESSPLSVKRKRRLDAGGASSDTSTTETDSKSVGKTPKLSPETNMKLKYMLGVNAWKYFVCFHDKSGGGKKLTPDLLTMRPDELNTALTLFMREAKMPSGGEFRGDSKYYLLLGIQYYLIENGRKINIFHDPACASLIDALEADAIKFNQVFRKWDATRLAEEHLWESKQLGVSSPEVLISTLIYFNTLHFRLLTVEDHLKLSFKSVVKHMKDADTSSSSKCSALRFYPPQDMLKDDPERKSMYEVEASPNKKRCHVHLFDFYLTKCPESAKKRGDVFYLVSEIACTSDSPVWYSDVAVTKEYIRKVLERVKMIKEVKQIMETK